VTRRFGRTLYRIFFGQYTEKAWGMPPSEISSNWASQRITLLSLWDTVKKTLFPGAGGTPRTLVRRFIYPKFGGIGELARGYARKIEEHGGRVLVNAPAIKVFREGCPTHEAVLNFASTAYLALARKVVFRLQRLTASGIYGDDYQHKTIWDEFCREVQNGPYGLLESAWEATVDPILESITRNVPSEEAALLTIGAGWELGREDEVGLASANPFIIHQNLWRVVVEIASTRDMSRFDPH
jgi:hypothetical protein